MTESEDSIQISNWDVLLQISERSGGSGYELCSESNHVGNNRFDVLLNMNRSHFEEAQKEGDSMPAVKRLIGIVTEQTSPPGRFLLRGSTWTIVPPDDVIAFVTELLTVPLQSSPELPKASEDSDPEGNERKRGRRSSLLRRSLSASVISALSESFMPDDKKKVSRGQRPSIKRVPWLSMRPARRTTIDARALDVIFNENGTELIAKHTGNNRLQVMVDMQQLMFQGSPESKQKDMIAEIQSTVHTHWGGRFLCQTLSGTFEEMTQEEQADALMSLLIGPPLAPHGVTHSDDTFNKSSSEATPSSSVLMNGGASAAIPLPEGIEGMRSAAVESLQKRKKRQGLASRIRSLAGRALRRTTSEPVKAPQKYGPPPAQRPLARSETVPVSYHHHQTPPIPEHNTSEHLLPFPDSSHGVAVNLSPEEVDDMLAGLDVSELTLEPPGSSTEFKNTYKL